MVQHTIWYPHEIRSYPRCLWRIHERRVRVRVQPVFDDLLLGHPNGRINLMEGISRPFDTWGRLPLHHVPIKGISRSVEGRRTANSRFVTLQSVKQSDAAIQMAIICDQKRKSLWVDDGRSVNGCDLLWWWGARHRNNKSGHDGAVVASGRVVCIIVLVLPIHSRDDTGGAGTPKTGGIGGAGTPSSAMGSSAVDGHLKTYSNWLDCLSQSRVPSLLRSTGSTLFVHERRKFYERVFSNFRWPVQSSWPTWQVLFNLRRNMLVTRQAGERRVDLTYALDHTLISHHT
jgi:hypothetical protein